MTKPESESFIKEGSQYGVREAGDTGLDIPDDDVDEVLNMLGDIDVDLDDLEDELSNFNYMSIPFGIVLPDFSIKMSFTLPSIFKANLGQPNSFNLRLRRRGRSLRPDDR